MHELLRDFDIKFDMPVMPRKVRMKLRFVNVSKFIVTFTVRYF